MKEIVLIIDRVRSMHNVGSFFRIADGAGVNEIALCGYTPTPPRQQIEKVSLGAELAVPWKYFATVIEAVKYYKKLGFQIVVVEKMEGARVFTDEKYSDRVALIVGHEIDGIDPELPSYADAIVYIPMKGVKESLNVSVAAGIVVYHVAVGVSR